MKFRSVLVAGGVLALGVVTFAHHIPVALSSLFGTEVLTEVTYFAQSDNLGVPAYRVGIDEHHVALTEGAQFSVTDGEGSTETVVFAPGLFADPSHADLHDVAEAIAAQLTIATAHVDNSSIVLHGTQGGGAASLTLSDGVGSPLSALGLLPGVVTGTDDIHLELSLPGEHEHGPGDDHEGSGLAHHPYLVVASATEGVTMVAGFEVPLILDTTTLLVSRATQFGLLPGFVGELSESEDASAVFETSLLPKLYPQGLPEKLYFSFVVFEEDLGGIAFVSNRFTAVLVDD
ncbi:MAG: hypothetical protein ACT4PU_13225 [Planctomycetota bacterium]